MLPGAISVLCESTSEPGARRGNPFGLDAPTAVGRRACSMVENGVPRAIAIRWNLLYTLTGTVSYLGANYLQLTVLAKMRGTEAVGDFAIANGWVLACLALAEMQLRQLRVTDRPDGHRLSDYLSLRSASSVLALMLLGLSVIVTGVRHELALLIAILAVQRTLESHSEVAYGEMQRAERMDLIALSQTLRSTIAIGLFAGLTYFGWSLVATCSAVMLISGLSLFAIDLPTAIQLSHPPSARTLPYLIRQRELLAAAAPFAMVAIVQAGCGQSSRFLIELTREHTELAHFVVASAPLSFVTLLTGALHQSTLSRAARHWQLGNWREFHHLCATLTVLFTAASGIGTVTFALFGADILEFLFTTEYRNSATSLVIMVGGLNLTAFATGFSLRIVVSRSSWIQFGTTVCGLLTLILCGCWLIPRYGVLGAAWTEFARLAAIATYQIAAGTWVYRQRRGADTPASLPAAPDRPHSNAA